MTTHSMELRDVHKSVQLPDGTNLQILKGIDCHGNPGEVIAVTGRSGSGKSTLLNLLGLLDTPTRGSVYVRGTDTTGISDTERAGLRFSTLGFVFQQFHLLARRSAVGNVTEALMYGSSHDLDTRTQRATKALERVGLGDRLHSLPHLLSGGEQQRVAIARALVTEPPIILADEPTGALDVDTGENVLELLVDLARRDNITLILVTHDLEIARKADRILHLDEGTLQEVGKP